MNKEFHLKIKNRDYSDKIILVGDPERAELIAKKYLKNYKSIIKERSFSAYTGYYKKNKITIQSSGIGTPSAAILLEELLSQHKIKKIIRIGSCCFINNKKLGDIIFARSILINDGTTKHYTNNSIKTILTNSNFKEIKGEKIVTVDAFYNPYLLRDIKKWKKEKIGAIEMESSILFYFGKKHKISVDSILVGIDKISTKNKKVEHKYLDKKTFNKYLNKAIKIALGSIEVC